MEKITFYNRNSSLNIILVIILSLLAILLVVDLFVELPAAVGPICFLFMSLYFAKTFFFKNYFEWNKKGANFKINKFISYGKGINFSHIKHYQIHDAKIEFIQKNNEVFAFDLSTIRKEDIEKLDEILLKHIPKAKEPN